MSSEIEYACKEYMYMTVSTNSSTSIILKFNASDEYCIPPTVLWVQQLGIAEFTSMQFIASLTVVFFNESS